MYKVDITTINNLSQKAKASDRRRMNLNIHKTEEDVMQRFLNAMEPGTYIRPHKHEMPHKRELFAVVRGEFLMLEFDDTGNVTDS
ncbi:MAG TPA: WbuC family cupin fold metalloprotein, partial [Bacteroidales bacterium]|nr:WbuC family cupin fold metalloprotein [Bacteroidales bacterium]